MKNKKTNNGYSETYNSTIFTKIYKNNLWGGAKGEYFSGPGSHNKFISSYANIITEFILRNKVKSIIEIGCGDFNVSGVILRGLDLEGYLYSYTGYDVVKPLIIKNKLLYTSSKIDFSYKDACTGHIKPGDLLIIRQVLQHLNNKSIKQIVSKFRNYKYIIFSEHQASEIHGDALIPNLDKKTNESIRLESRSGVYLDKDPFNCNIDSLIYSIPERIFGLEAAINTYLIKNELPLNTSQK
jgi:hypothetical protein